MDLSGVSMTSPPLIDENPQPLTLVQVDTGLKAKLRIVFPFKKALDGVYPFNSGDKIELEYVASLTELQTPYIVILVKTGHAYLWCPASQ